MISCMPVFCFYKASEWRCSAFQIVAAWHGGFSCNFTEATGSGSITCRAEQCREEQGRYTWLLININVDWFIDRRRLGVGVQTYRLYNRSSSFGRRSTRIRKRDHWTILEHICTRWHRISFLMKHFRWNKFRLRQVAYLRGTRNAADSTRQMMFDTFFLFQWKMFDFHISFLIYHGTL